MNPRPAGGRLEAALTVLLTASAIAIAVALVQRTFFPSAPRGARSDAPPTYEQSWRSFLATAQVDGDTTGAPVVLVFSDFECPFCKDFHERLRRVQAATSPRPTLAFVHFPLRMHRFARPAAAAAECAAGQGRFFAFTDAIFAKQDSLGLKSWVSFAADAGVVDTATFSNCLRASPSPRRVDEGVAAGESLKVEGTPTVLIDGWRYEVPPDDSVLHHALRARAGSRD